MEKAYIIWSVEHNMWWRASSCGYTHKLSDAGIYGEKRAREIVKKANGRDTFNECMIPQEYFN